MNKAFIREPDATTSHCPRCGSLGVPVLRDTLQARLRPDAVDDVSERAAFCPFPTCDVAYFDDLERTVPVSALREPVWPKDPDAPICPCFGITCEDLEADARAGIVTRVRDLIAKANSPEAHCSQTSPTGKTCIADVQRYYLKARTTN